MFQLAEETDPRWASGVIKDLGELLLEHAHLERKAAFNALQLMFRYPQHDFMQKPLSALAREELRHFEAVLEVLRQRGMKFQAQRPSPYAGRLLQIVRQREPGLLLDRLL